MAKKVKYIASLVIFALIAFAFIFSTVFRISNRNIPKASAINGYGFDASTGALTVMGPTNDEVTASDVISACEDKSNIKKVDVQEDIAKIGDGALEGCANLSEITFGGTLNAIGENAFKDCTSLQAIDIPSAEEEENLSIGANAFNGCSALEKISFSDVDSLTGATMDPNAFSGIPENCTVYADDSVINSNNPDYSDVCTKLKAAGIPEKCLSKTEDENPYSFDTNTGILTIKGNVETVTQAMVAETCGEDYKTTLKEVIIEEGVTSIGTDAFSGCENLASITIPNSVTSIGGGAFSTSALESVTIPEGVKSIGNSAFYQCQKIESITIPKSVESIGQYAFAQCYSLNKITFSGEIIPTLGEKAFWTIADAGEIYLNGQRVKGGSAAFNTLNDAGVPEAWFEKTSITADMFELKNTKKIYDGKAEDVEISHPDDLISYYLQYSKANSDGTWGDFTEDKPLNAGIYKIGVVVKDDEIYKDAELELNGDFTISKATPTADMFTFNPPKNNGEGATFSFNPEKSSLKEEEVGKITVWYSKQTTLIEEQPIWDDNWTTDAPKDAGSTYRCGITTSGSNNCKDNMIINDSNWTFIVPKIKPTADMFTFNPPGNLTYDGEGKTASVMPKEGIEGMGTVTVKYYSDPECTVEITDPKNAGTYYVGINVTEGENYLATTEILKKDEWNFQITKATPTADMFTFNPPGNLTYDGEGKTASVMPKEGIEGMGTVTVKYYSDLECTVEITDPKNAGTYYVGINVTEGENYLATTEILKKNEWKFEITKAIPTADMFTFTPPGNLVYNGEGKSASVVFNTQNGKLSGMGNITVKYSADGGSTWNTETPKNAGTYYVGIEVGEGTNYSATTEILKKDEWKFEITKATPTADMFTFNLPENLVYNGEGKSASVVFNTQNGKLSGMGNITVKYSADGGSTWNTETPKNAGTYYVGIEVGEGTNYSATTGILTKSDDWNFTIGKANGVIPNVDNLSATYGQTLSEVTLPAESDLGSWAWQDGSTKIDSVGNNKEFPAIFTPKDKINYDWSKSGGTLNGDGNVEVNLKVSVVVDKTNWGKEVNVGNGIKNYVSDDGTTSVEITGTNGRYWVKEESYDRDLGRVTSAWYGVDNSNRVFEPGSRLCVHWINKVENPEEWEKYRKMMDITETQEHEWIFIADVIKPNGEYYRELSQPVPFYVQLGDDWDIEDVKARFISEGEDEDVTSTYINSLEYPGGKGEFMMLTLRHFSPYAIYDEKDTPNVEPGANNQNNNQESQENQENQQQENESDSPNTSNDNTKTENNNYYVIWILAGGAVIFTASATIWQVSQRIKNKNRKKQKFHN